MPRFYTSGIILLIKQSNEIGEKQFLFSGSRGGQKSPLMHVLVLGVLSGVFHYYSNSNRTFYEQTVEILIRQNVLRRLIWVCAVRPKMTMCLYRLTFCRPEHQNANSKDLDEMPQTHGLLKSRSSEKEIQYLFTFKSVTFQYIQYHPDFIV